jgi:hypothetical protein
VGLLWSVSCCWTEGVTVILHDLGQLPDQRFLLYFCQLKVRHHPKIGLPTSGVKSSAEYPMNPFYVAAITCWL